MRLYNVILLLLIWGHYGAYSQGTYAPGGVSEKLRLWIRPDSAKTAGGDLVAPGGTVDSVPPFHGYGVKAVPPTHATEVSGPTIILDSMLFNYDNKVFHFEGRKGLTFPNFRFLKTSIETKDDGCAKMKKNPSLTIFLMGRRGERNGGDAVDYAAAFSMGSIKKPDDTNDTLRGVFFLPKKAGGRYTWLRNLHGNRDINNRGTGQAIVEDAGFFSRVLIIDQNNNNKYRLQDRGRENSTLLTYSYRELQSYDSKVYGSPPAVYADYLLQYWWEPSTCGTLVDKVKRHLAVPADTFTLGYGVNYYTENAEPHFGNYHIAEFLVYDTTLKNNERQRVTSYLALKYGRTLQAENGREWGAIDYLLSDGKVVWKALENGVYSHNIAGVGKDETSGLYRYRSRSTTPIWYREQGWLHDWSTDYTDTADIYFGDQSPDIVAMSIVDRGEVDDKEFLVWSTNSGQLGLNLMVQNPQWDIGDSMYVRMGRKWRVSELNGDVGEVRVSILDEVWNDVYVGFPGQGQWQPGQKSKFDVNMLIGRTDNRQASWYTSPFRTEPQRETYAKTFRLVVNEAIHEPTEPLDFSRKGHITFPSINFNDRETFTFYAKIPKPSVDTVYVAVEEGDSVSLTREGEEDIVDGILWKATSKTPGTEGNHGLNWEEKADIVNSQNAFASDFVGPDTTTLTIEFGINPPEDAFIRTVVADTTRYVFFHKAFTDTATDTVYLCNGGEKIRRDSLSRNHRGGMEIEELTTEGVENSDNDLVEIDFNRGQQEETIRVVKRGLKLNRYWLKKEFSIGGKVYEDNQVVSGAGKTYEDRTLLVVVGDTVRPIYQRPANPTTAPDTLRLYLSEDSCDYTLPMTDSIINYLVDDQAKDPIPNCGVDSITEWKLSGSTQAKGETSRPDSLFKLDTTKLLFSFIDKNDNKNRDSVVMIVLDTFPLKIDAVIDGIGENQGSGKTTAEGDSIRQFKPAPMNSIAPDTMVIRTTQKDTNLTLLPKVNKWDCIMQDTIYKIDTIGGQVVSFPKTPSKIEDYNFKLGSYLITIIVKDSSAGRDPQRHTDTVRFVLLVRPRFEITFTLNNTSRRGDTFFYDACETTIPIVAENGFVTAIQSKPHALTDTFWTLNEEVTKREDLGNTTFIHLSEQNDKAKPKRRKITVKAKDKQDNVDSIVFYVQVFDSRPPVITKLSSNTIRGDEPADGAACGKKYTTLWDSVQFTHPCPEIEVIDSSWRITNSRNEVVSDWIGNDPDSLSNFTFNGIKNVIFWVTSDNGISSKDSLVVDIADTRPPVLTLDNDTLKYYPHSCDTILGQLIEQNLTAEDCDDELTYRWKVNGGEEKTTEELRTERFNAGNRTKGAIYTIEASVSDAHKNRADTTFVIAVYDTIAPTVTAHGGVLIIEKVCPRAQCANGCKTDIKDTLKKFVQVTDNCDLIPTDWKEEGQEMESELKFCTSDKWNLVNEFEDVNGNKTKFILPIEIKQVYLTDYIEDSVAPGSGILIKKKLPPSVDSSWVEIIRPPHHGSATIDDPKTGEYTYTPGSSPKKDSMTIRFCVRENNVVTCTEKTILFLRDVTPCGVWHTRLMTPDNDGVNDKLLIVVDKKCYANGTIIAAVYDRGGNLMAEGRFSGSDLSEIGIIEWEPRLASGKPLPAEFYVLSIKVSGEEEKNIHGWFDVTY